MICVCITMLHGESLPFSTCIGLLSYFWQWRFRSNWPRLIDHDWRHFVIDLSIWVTRSTYFGRQCVSPFPATEGGGSKNTPSAVFAKNNQVSSGIRQLLFVTLSQTLLAVTGFDPLMVLWIRHWTSDGLWVCMELPQWSTGGKARSGIWDDVFQRLKYPGLPWIWNFPSISIPISTYFYVDIHGYIHIHRRLSCLPVATKFPQNSTSKGVHPPMTRTQTFPSIQLLHNRCK